MLFYWTHYPVFVTCDSYIYWLFYLFTLLLFYPYPSSSTYLFNRSVILFWPVHRPLHINLSTWELLLLWHFICLAHTSSIIKLLQRNLSREFHAFISCHILLLIIVFTTPYIIYDCDIYVIYLPRGCEFNHSFTLSMRYFRFVMYFVDTM